MEQISWEIHLAKRHPLKTTVVSFILIAFLILTYLLYGPLWLFFTLIVFFITLNPYFLPHTYTLDKEGILIDKRIYKTRRRWKEFRRFYLTKNGLVLSTFHKRNFLDNFRGLHILLPPDSEKVIEFIRDRLTPPLDKSSFPIKI